MKLLMIVGSADSIFIYNIAKWLKKSLDINIDIFELEPSPKNLYDNSYYNLRDAYKQPISNSKIQRIISNKFRPYFRSHQLKLFLKDKHYDIIHAHCITNSLVVSRNLKKHCNKLCLTFWGGELTHQTIFGSHTLYMCYLKSLIKQADYVVNSSQFKTKLNNISIFPKVFHPATLGSSSIDYLLKLMTEETKETVKKKLGMPLNKTVVMIGYSGKPLHQHLNIIKALKTSNNLINGIHIFAPMTRDGNSTYIDKVNIALAESGFSYTLIRDKYLSDEEVALTRFATDIVFQFSTFDGFSRSVIEGICAKALLIYGDWLNYTDRLDYFGFQALSASSIDEGVKILETILPYMHNYDDLLEQNSENGKMKLLWSECIKDWVNLYKSI